MPKHTTIRRERNFVRLLVFSWEVAGEREQRKREGGEQGGGSEKRARESVREKKREREERENSARLHSRPSTRERESLQVHLHGSAERDRSKKQKAKGTKRPAHRRTGGDDRRQRACAQPRRRRGRRPSRCRTSRDGDSCHRSGASQPTSARSSATPRREIAKMASPSPPHLVAES